MSKGIVVLEGPDASGKSTLAAAMKDKYGAVVIHAERRWLDKMQVYHTAILLKAVDLAFKQNKLVILDRHWPSEEVYGSVFRGGVAKGYTSHLFQNILRRFKVLYVMCLPSRGQAMMRHKALQDPDHPYDDHQYNEIWYTYEKMWQKYRVKEEWIRYNLDYEGRNMDHARLTIRSLLDFNQQPRGEFDV